MKASKHYLVILGITAAILPVTAWGRMELPQPDEPILIAPPNPALVGIEPLVVVITTHGQEPNRSGLDIKILKTEVERTLEKAGIKVFGPKKSVTYKPAISSDIKVSLEMLYIEDSKQCVFRVQTSLSRAARLDGQGNRLFKADVWTTEPVMQIEQLKDIRSKATKVILSQVDAFILAYRTTIRPDISSPDANESPLLQVPAIKESSKQPVKRVVTEYQYVASKNSDVFHTPTCRSAKRISPENLVGYKARQEAINAGKRPCKLCTP